MNQRKISKAVGRLEQNPPLRHNQLRLPGVMRRLHQSILGHYVEYGAAPALGDIDRAEDRAAGI